MHRWYTAFVLLLISSVQARGDALSDADELLKQRFPADKPGAAVLVVSRGQPALMNGYGVADLEKKTPITPDSQFDLASVSKQFTAMAVMILAERGKLNYDDPIRKWIPEMPEFDSSRPIKLRDLLNHTSGLPDYLFLMKGGDNAFSQTTCFDVPALFKDKKLKHPTGSKFDYSNTNYALLPVVVERASGKTFSMFVNDHIFQPLGMTQSKVMDRFPYQLENRVFGYGRKLLTGKLEISKRDGPICGDGNVFSTVRDFVRWDAGLAQHRLVRPETMEFAWTSGKLDDGKETGYGFGWAVKMNYGRKFVVHSGGWAGTRTVIARWLPDELTIVVLSNDEGANPNKIANDLAKLFLPPPQPASGPAPS